MSHQRQLESLALLYGLYAPIYDLITAPFCYAKARSRAVQLLRLREGQTVLDVGCGTGLNIPLLRQGVGARGRVIGVDYTDAMLARSQARARRGRWDNVSFLRLDAARLSLDALQEANLLAPGGSIDAAICTLALSVIPAWDQAYRAMLHTVRPGGRVAIMDTGYPPKPGDTGELAALRPLLMLVCRLAGAPGSRQPWLRLPHDTDSAVTETFNAGYVGVSAGTIPDA